VTYLHTSECCHRTGTSDSGESWPAWYAWSWDEAVARYALPTDETNRKYYTTDCTTDALSSDLNTKNHVILLQKRNYFTQQSSALHKFAVAELNQSSVVPYNNRSCRKWKYCCNIYYTVHDDKQTNICYCYTIDLSGNFTRVVSRHPVQSCDVWLTAYLAHASHFFSIVSMYFVYNFYNK